MKEELIKNIDNPQQLESLYRNNKEVFKKEFNALYPDIKENKTADCWHERLNYESSELSWGTSKDLIFVIIASLFAGLIAKLPEFLSLDADFFYPRNMGFIVFPILTIYFAWKNGFQTKKIILASVVTLTALVFINVLPNNDKSDTLVLACIHLPLFLWAVLGFAFLGKNLSNNGKRLDFLRYNGDVIVMTSLILIAGMILTGITIGLFSLIGFEIAEFYIQYIVVLGLAASPIVGTYMTQTNPQLVSKVSPVIAKVFSPLVLITLVIYLVAIIYSGKDPYNDRDFLLTFNMLLVGVMAIILFSVAETSRTRKNQIGIYILFLLALVTVIINGIALTAILFRISEWGITPNRIAVFGADFLILINLLIVTRQLLKVINKTDKIGSVEKSITTFLPIYSIWTIFVIFVMPLIFGFK